MPTTMLQQYVRDLAVAFVNQAARDGVRIELNDMRLELERYASAVA